MPLYTTSFTAKSWNIRIQSPYLRTKIAVVMVSRMSPFQLKQLRRWYRLFTFQTNTERIHESMIKINLNASAFSLHLIPDFWIYNAYNKRLVSLGTHKIRMYRPWNSNKLEARISQPKATHLSNSLDTRYYYGKNYLRMNDGFRMSETNSILRNEYLMRLFCV